MTRILSALYRAVIGPYYRMEDGESVPLEYRTLSQLSATASSQEVAPVPEPGEPQLGAIDEKGTKEPS